MRKEKVAIIITLMGLCAFGAAKEAELLTREKPAWFNSQAGICDEVLPPWTPLKVRKLRDVAVECWGRQYIFTDSPFPDQIVSAGESLLAEPISIRVSVGGKVVSWQARQVQLVEQRPQRVVLSARADSSELSLRAKTTVEYDGMVKVDCAFTPKKKFNVDGLIVKVPMKQERALYFNSPWVTRFASPLEYKGSIDHDGWEWHHSFVPSLSLRDDKRGLDWACESDEGWKPYDRPDTLRVYRKGDTVTLEVRVLGKSMLRDPLKVSMILQATPVRPFLEGYRQLNILHFWGGPDKDGQTWDIEGFGRAFG